MNKDKKGSLAKTKDFNIYVAIFLGLFVTQIIIIDDHNTSFAVRPSCETDLQQLTERKKEKRKERKKKVSGRWRPVEGCGGALGPKAAGPGVEGEVVW